MRLKLIIALLLIAALGAGWWSRPLPPPIASQFPTSRVVYASNGELLRLTTANDQRYRLWLPLSEFSPLLIEAVLLKEDQWFFHHFGVNPWRLMEAALASSVGSQRQGASTLTMQLARLQGRLKTRTVRGKLRQIVAAIGLELRYSKAEILEAYLNLAPYGLNVEGAGTASLIYFNKAASALTPNEALTLAVLPQRPRLERDGASLRLPPDLLAARSRLVAQWLLADPARAATRQLLIVAPELRSPTALPFAAPHVVEQLLRDDAAAGATAIYSTLDPNLQQVLQTKISGYLRSRRALGMRNAAAMLVDTRDLAVKAMVGSADYFDASIDGQVNAANAKRSPGSTLKPFIYALGIDQGVLHPRTVLRDVPSAFGPFAPENFDGRFLGPVTATDALVRSRNIPAVAVAARLNNPSLYDFLRAANISQLRSERHYGLALVLGGGEVTMSELATLYAMLSRDGEYRPLRWHRNDPVSASLPLLSAEASFITREMLKENPRPDGSRGRLPVAWKTGTSWGFRDAWSAGIVGPYVLVVWMGNFDGAPNPALIGATAAAPLFFSIVDALAGIGQDLNEPARRWPLNLKRVAVCRLSGELPNAWCPDTADTWFIPGKSPIRLSTLHRPVWIDNTTGAAVCAENAGPNTHIAVFEFWPSELAQAFIQAGVQRRAPPHAPSCTHVSTASAPAITSPRRGVQYQLNTSTELPLKANADASVQRLYWFADGAYLGSSAPGAALNWTPARVGRVLLSVIDDQGGQDAREVDLATFPLAQR